MTNETAHCNLCESIDHQFMFKNYDRMFPEIKGYFNVLKCKNCGLIFLHPQPSTKDLIMHYPNNYSVLEEGKIEHYRKLFTLIETFYQYCNLKSNESKFLKLINLFFSPISSLFRTTKYVEKGNSLDVGCGIGYFPLVMQYLGMNAYGVEPGDFDDELSKRYNLNIFNGTLLEAKYDDNFFDLITVNHILEHVSNPYKLMIELNRILKENGHIIIATPISDSFAFKLFGKYWAQIDTPRHLFIFSNDVLKKYAEKCGFEVIKIRYNSTPAFQIISSVIYLIENKINRKFFRSSIKNPLFNVLLMPLTFILNLIRKGDQVEIILKKA
jgi:SAM-dependent methyltransferase